MNVHHPEITCLEWCAGYAGIGLGLKRAIPNLRTIAFSEIEAFACANLVSKMEAGLLDSAPIWTDLKTFPSEEFHGIVDILVAGYPCQPFSAAGKRLGVEDPRHLWPFIRRAIRVIRPRICFFENVEGHVSLGLSTVISDLEEDGYKTTWGIFSATEVGAPHQRKRVFILAYDERQGLEGFRGFIQKPIWEKGFGQSEVPFSSIGGFTWPSRPGEPQHEWEPPRVVEKLGDTPSLRPCGSCENSGTIDKDSDGEKCGLHESEGASPLSGDGSQSEAMVNSDGLEGWRASNIQGNSHERSTCPERLAGSSQIECDRQAKSTMGGNADGNPDRLDDAKLYVATDNRTDELRLLGNGVVPATAERAFKTLLKEIL